MSYTSTITQKPTIKAHGIVSKPVSMPNWERVVRQHTYSLKHCLKTENFHYVHTSKALILAEQRFKAAGEPSPGDKVVQDIMEGASTDQQSNMEEFTNQVEQLKGTPPDPPTWQQKIDEQRQKAKARADAAIDSAADSAIDAIAAMPEDQRDSASNVFVTASNIVMDLIDQLVTQLRAVFDSIRDFLQGVWDELQNAYHAVVGAVTTAVDAIRGIFSLAADVVASKLVAPQRTFVARLNWPASVGMSAAASKLGYLSNQLHRHHYQFDYQNVRRRNNQGVDVIESVTHIKPIERRTSPSRYAAQTDGGASAKRVWNECIADLGNDGHFIPEHTTGLANGADEEEY